jgi:DNA-binding GntR family transcriptional regulator
MQAPKYQSLKDHVYHYIAEKIQDGTLQPNQKINEAEICKHLDISRTPTREALFQLASDNLLVYIPRRGFTVKAFDSKKKLDYSQIIGVLDALAATLAVERLMPSELMRMEELVDKIDADIDRRYFEDYYSDQYRFHEIYTLHCDNPTLMELLGSMKNSFIKQAYTSDDKEKLARVLKQVNSEHRKIIDLFRTSNKAGLEAALHHHWRIIDDEML